MFTEKYFSKLFFFLTLFKMLFFVILKRIQVSLDQSPSFIYFFYFYLFSHLFIFLISNTELNITILYDRVFFSCKLYKFCTSCKLKTHVRDESRTLVVPLAYFPIEIAKRTRIYIHKSTRAA